MPEKLTFLLWLLPLLLVIGLLIRYLLLSGTKSNKQLIEKLTNYLTEKSIPFEISEENNSAYDALIKIKDSSFLIKTLAVPQNAEIVINNRTTWELRYGAGNNPGKAQPYKQYIPAIIPFMNYESDIDHRKVLIVSPKPKKVVKWINECEMIFVDPKTNVYGINIINDKEFDYFE